MKQGVWILGAGGHAKVIAGAILAAGGSLAGLLDDDERLEGSHVLGHQVARTPDAEWWREQERIAIIGIGGNQIRKRLAATIDANWFIVRHPHSWCDPSAQIGDGTLICAGVVVQPDVQVGAHAILNTGCSIDHDCQIGDFTHIAPGVTLAGDVKIGAECFIGAGATVLPGVEIGTGVTVGAAAVVTKNVEAGATVVGVPARRIKV